MESADQPGMDGRRGHGLSVAATLALPRRPKVILVVHCCYNVIYDAKLR